MLTLNLSIISRNGREVVGTATLPCRPKRELAAGLVVTGVEAEVAVAEVVIVPVMGRLALKIGRVVNVTAAPVLLKHRQERDQPILIHP